MDLGIAGKWALVCAASKGLGRGCAEALVREGVNVVITARGAEALEATARELRALNAAVTVHAVAGDIATPEGRAAGSLAWAGLSNLYFWIDRAQGVTGVFASQMLPFFDTRAVQTFQNFERSIYAMHS